MNRFRILHTEWSDGWGGQEIRICADLKVMTALGHEPVLMAAPGSQIAEKARTSGFRVVEQPMRHTLDLAAVYQMAFFMRREGFDVVNTHSSIDSWLASAAAKLARVPVLVRTRHLSVPLNTHAFNFVYKWPDAFVTTAEMIRRRMIDVNGVAPDRVVSIPTGVDLDEFNPNLDPGGIREELGLSPGDRVLTMVAVLRSWKRHDLFLEAGARVAETHPDVKMVIAGEGPQREAIEARIHAMGLGGRVVMTGHRNDIPRILAVSDICLLTSESSEGVPQSVLQYQAMARPVVACTAGGIPEVVQDGETGLLCPPKDADAVARAVSRLLDNLALARTLGLNARKQVKARHSLMAMARQTLDLYEKIYRIKKRR